MRQDIAIWNLLHDGGLAEVTGSIPRAVGIRVEIPYLHHTMFSSDGDSFWIELLGCGSCKFSAWGAAAPVGSLAELEAVSPEILSAEEDAGVAHITCLKGRWSSTTRAQAYKARQRAAVSYAELESAARKYWEQWGKEKNA